MVGLAQLLKIVVEVAMQVAAKMVGVFATLKSMALLLHP
jgi:hypothetical protein